MGRKKRKNRDDIISIYSNSEVYTPNDHNQLYQSYNTNSWFNIKHTLNKSIKQKFDNTIHDNYYTRKFIFLPTEHQKFILNRWFIGTTNVYNHALKYIKSKQYYKIKENPSFYSIRNDIKSIKSKYKDTKAHILDQSIANAVQNYKSALSNYRKGNFKSFRIRYHKNGNNSDKTVYLEPAYVSKKNKITMLGDVKLLDIDSKKEYLLSKENINSIFEIKYKHKINKYYMYIPFKKKYEDDNVKEDYISIDPGISPLMTGITESNCVQIGDNIYNKVKSDLDKFDKYNNRKIEKKRKDKLLNRLKTKLRNRINDLHWKTINYLTKNYNKILIGDFSVKGCVESNGIVKMSKRVLHNFRLFILKQRLKLRCEALGMEYVEVDEDYTSKRCSNCGNIKHDLRLEKVYKCNIDDCKTVMNRDVNGARNIYYNYKYDTIE